MKKVLLLNLPGEKTFIRDYYCSHISKGIYALPPIDLLVLSGILYNHFKLFVIDALIKKLTYNYLNQQIKSISPDIIICLTGAVSWTTDMSYLETLTKKQNTLLIITGDYPLAKPLEILAKYPFVDAILCNFTDLNIINFLQNTTTSNTPNIITRHNNYKNKINTNKSFEYPSPRHKLFPLKNYHLPHIKYHPFTVILTDFGCPFKCTFCPFERIKHSTRDIENIGEELQHITSCKIKELWLRDQSFGSIKQHALNFCNYLLEANLSFSWSCEMRVDCANEDLLKSMKQVGCHTIMFGVESANQKVLDNHNKHISITQIKNAFNLAHKLKFKSLAHFIIGLNGETKTTQEELIAFSISINPTYASFNIATPLFNTTFREIAIKNTWLKNQNIEIDSSCSYPIWENKKLKRDDIWEFTNLALKKFYFRPSYIFKRVLELKTSYQLYILIREGISFISITIKRYFILH